MIRRLYVDNFRTLVDFTWRPMPETLVLGVNGSGKTAALDSLDIIRNWVWGWKRVEDTFDADTLTRWRESAVARFELDVEILGSFYCYKVEFDCSARDKTPSVKAEALSVDGEMIVLRSDDAVTFRLGETGGGFPLATNQSAVASLFAGRGSETLDPFLSVLSRMVVVRPLPHLMVNEAKHPQQRVEGRLENFVAWYWEMAASGHFPTKLQSLLSSVWPEFDYLQLSPVGRARSLSVVFKQPIARDTGLRFEFHELSEGERMLIVLYALAAYQELFGPATIIVDEPDNFVAMSELQPWLLQMLDGRPAGGQVIIVSHNHEIIETMGDDRVAYFERLDHFSPTEVRKILPDESELSLTERISRGWLPTSSVDVAGDHA